MSNSKEMTKNELIMRDLSYEVMEINELLIILGQANNVVERLIRQITDKTSQLESSIIIKLGDK